MSESLSVHPLGSAAAAIETNYCHKIIIPIEEIPGDI